MSKQRIIKDEMWDDEWFYELDPSEKLIWVFLLTNPRNNIAGVYQLSRRWGANATGFDRDVFDGILARFGADGKIKTDGEWIVLNKFYKHQSKNPKVEAGIIRILENTPKNIVKLLNMDSLCIAYPTLLNSTLLNLSVSEDESSTKEVLNNKTDMSFNKKGEDYEEGFIDLDGDGSLLEEKKPQTKKYPNAPQVRKVFLAELGKNPKNWNINKTQLLSCENLYTERGLKTIQNALRWYKEHKDMEYCPQITSPYDLDSKWTKLSAFKKQYGNQ